MRAIGLGLLMWASAATASPTSVSWQGRFLDGVGGAAEGLHSVRIALYDASDATLWSKQFTGVELAGGYASLVLSGTGDVGGVLDTAHFQGAVFVGVALNGDSELSPRQALTAVPRAVTAESIVGALPALGTTSVCGVGTVGTLRFHDSRLEICSGGGWKLVVETHPTAKHVALGADGVRTWSDGTAAQSCESYRRPVGDFLYSGETGSGVYRIAPPGHAAFDVECDMDFDGGGWTLVGRGIGGATAGWKDTTGDLNVAQAVGGHQTFKFSDARINAIPKSVYRFVGFGEIHQDWYWSGTCVYGHQTASSGACNQAYHNPNLAPAQSPGNTTPGHTGLGDWTGSAQDHLHTSHASYHWYIKSSYDDAVGDWCHGAERGCDVRLWVR